MKDFCPAVGMMPLILWRVFGTTRWRPVTSLHCFHTMRKKAEPPQPTITGGDSIAAAATPVKAEAANSAALQYQHHHHGSIAELGAFAPLSHSLFPFRVTSETTP